MLWGVLTHPTRRSARGLYEREGPEEAKITRTPRRGNENAWSRAYLSLVVEKVCRRHLYTRVTRQGKKTRVFGRGNEDGCDTTSAATAALSVQWSADNC